ncbi:CCD89 protein, partial [Atractosteus spatula]|nr:CCD89 protein [Atractosteus spatula]
EMDDVHTALEKLRGLSQDDKTESALLRSRIDEQSSLICILKQRADEMLLRCQALERINSELETLREDVHKELENERKRSSQLEQRFLDLAANHQELINFKDEYKRQKAELKEENERLQLILQLTQELKDLAEQHKILEAEYKEKTNGFQTKLKELIITHQTKEASLQGELQDTQKQLKDAVEMCTELDLQLRRAMEKDALEESQLQQKLEALVKEKDELLDLSMQRGRIIQDKQKEIQELEEKREEAEKARSAAEERFEKEAAAVEANLKVQDLQRCLDESEQSYNDLKKDFEAYKKHSSDLLAKEKELNAKLRHMIG